MQENNQLIISLIIIFTVFLFCMGLFFLILINKYYRNLKKRQIESLNNLIIGQDNERARIARDIHDEMGPSLSYVIFTIDNIKPANAEDLEVKIKAIKDVRNVIKRLRQISHNLMPPSLHKYGLIDALKEMIDNHQYENLECKFFSNVLSIDISDQIKSNLYHIIDELIYNTYKHGNATTVNINLNYNENLNDLDINYEDNGIGFIEHTEEKDGIGIKNIKTRLRLINGDISLSGTNGFKAFIKIKLK